MTVQALLYLLASFPHDARVMLRTATGGDLLYITGCHRHPHDSRDVYADVPIIVIEALTHDWDGTPDFGE